MNQKGFGLIEAMLAVGVLAFGALSLTAAQLDAQRTRGSAFLGIAAVNQAEAALNSVKSAAVSDWAGALAYRPAPAGPLPQTVTVVAEPNGLLKATATVSWDERGTARQVRLETLLAAP